METEKDITKKDKVLFRVKHKTTILVMLAVLLTGATVGSVTYNYKEGQILELRRSHLENVELPLTQQIRKLKIHILSLEEAAIWDESEASEKLDL